MRSTKIYHFRNEAYSHTCNAMRSGTISKDTNTDTTDQKIKIKPIVYS